MFLSLFTHQHPSWLYECKSHRINKIKGRLSFPLKTKPPSGATVGGIPPKKWSHFFRKKLTANVLSTPQPKFWANLRGTQVARG
jgi:hypothetical protein